MLRFDEVSTRQYEARMSADVRAVQRAYPQIYLACHTRHRRTATSDEGLSPRDGALLSHVDELRGVRPTDLARHLGIGLSTLSEAIDRLSDRGYVAVAQAKADRRARELRLTKKGVSALAATSVLDGKRVAAVLGRLSDSERRAALRGISLLARASREQMLSAKDTKKGDES
jgi:DNA-binding MarR family transcriptional regulator